MYMYALYAFTFTCTHISNMYTHTVYEHSHVHTRVARSGVHLPSAAHTALILPGGTNPGLHLKNISAPSVVF